MKLFEVLELGSAQVILRILRDLANKSDDYSTIPFPALKSRLEQYGYPIGDGGPESADVLEKIKKKIDPDGKIIQSIDPKTATITLDTEQKNPNEPQTGGRQVANPTVDRMARRNAATGSLKSD